MWKVLDIKETSDIFDYWVNETKKEFCSVDGFVDLYKKFLDSGSFRVMVDDENRGIFAFIVIDDFRGQKTICELFMMIKKENRGSIKLFKDMIKSIESYAIENKINAIEIGSNIGYNDESVIKILTKLFGYKHYSVRKEI